MKTTSSMEEQIGSTNEELAKALGVQDYINVINYNYYNQGNNSNASKVFTDSNNSVMSDFNTTNENRVFESNGRITMNVPLIDFLSRKNSYLERAVTFLSSKPLINGIDINIHNNALTSEEMFKVKNRIKNLYEPLKETIGKGYIYGGSAGLITLSNEKASDYVKPLLLNKVTKDSFAGIKPLSRWFQIEPCLEGDDALVTVIGAKEGILDAKYIGMPKYYWVSFGGALAGNSDEARGFKLQDRYKVHRSRLVLFHTFTPSFIEKQIERYWGTSLIEYAYENLMNDKRLWQATVKSAEKNNMSILKIDGLALSSNVTTAQENMIKARMKIIADGSSKNMLPISNKDEFTFATAALSGQGEVIKLSNSRLASAFRVSVPVLFPNETSQAEDSSYIQSLPELQNTQETFLRDAFNMLIPIIIKSETGKDVPPFTYVFNPIETQKLLDKAQMAKINSETLVNLHEIGAFDQVSIMNAIEDLGKDPSFFAQHINKEYLEDILSKSKNGNFITKDSKQIEVAKALNQFQKDNEKGTSGVSNPESDIRGGNEGGNNKTTQKKPIKKGELGNPSK